ncbi:hypothetical protein [Eikenella corrodens]|uniref:hypothetical protein n=1 Tax=Eikenella corrodens TaxID=539 RepID=UPI001177F7CF|nr:hypothetical protein [Eikenella corrodens]
MQPIKTALPNRICKTTPQKPGLKHQPHAIPQPAESAHAEFAPSEFRAASRVRDREKILTCAKWGYIWGYINTTLK